MALNARHLATPCAVTSRCTPTPRPVRPLGVSNTFAPPRDCPMRNCYVLPALATADDARLTLSACQTPSRRPDVHYTPAQRFFALVCRPFTLPCLCRPLLQLLRPPPATALPYPAPVTAPPRRRCALRALATADNASSMAHDARVAPPSTLGRPHAPFATPPCAIARFGHAPSCRRTPFATSRDDAPLPRTLVPLPAWLPPPPSWPLCDAVTRRPPSRRPPCPSHTLWCPIDDPPRPSARTVRAPPCPFHAPWAFACPAPPSARRVPPFSPGAMRSSCPVGGLTAHPVISRPIPPSSCRAARSSCPAPPLSRRGPSRGPSRHLCAPSHFLRATPHLSTPPPPRHFRVPSRRLRSPCHLRASPRSFRVARAVSQPTPTVFTSCLALFASRGPSRARTAVCVPHSAVFTLRTVLSAPLRRLRARVALADPRATPQAPQQHRLVARGHASHLQPFALPPRASATQLPRPLPAVMSPLASVMRCRIAAKRPCIAVMRAHAAIMRPSGVVSSLMALRRPPAAAARARRRLASQRCRLAPLQGLACHCRPSLGAPRPAFANTHPVGPSSAPRHHLRAWRSPGPALLPHHPRCRSGVPPRRRHTPRCRHLTPPHRCIVPGGAVLRLVAPRRPRTFSGCLHVPPHPCIPHPLARRRMSPRSLAPPCALSRAVARPLPNPPLSPSPSLSPARNHCRPAVLRAISFAMSALTCHVAAPRALATAPAACLLARALSPVDLRSGIPLAVSPPCVLFRVARLCAASLLRVP
ncbi:hypothetical protein DENSPDRAFT_885454 [Dentipellis sp. KUC8613]|nr:hypothetical protein DENSPDRAFT_885454 [Dentipellis sp. KUC8613]